MPLLFILHKAFEAFLENRLHISASSLALMWCWAKILVMPIRPIDYLIISLAVTCICQWNRLTDLPEDRVNCPEELQKALRAGKRIKLFCYMSGTAAAFLAITTDPRWPVVAIVSAGAAIGFYYNTPLFPAYSSKRMKNIFILKNLSSAAGWSLGILLYPAVRSGHALGYPFWTAFAYTFITIMTYELIWDIRDMKGDKTGEIKSLPLVIGSSRTKNVIYTLQTVSIGLILTGLLQHHFHLLWSFLIAHAVMLMVITFFFHQHLRFSRRLTHAMVFVSLFFSLGLGLLASWMP